jgi:hypothetical protein
VGPTYQQGKEIEKEKKKREWVCGIAGLQPCCAPGWPSWGALLPFFVLTIFYFLFLDFFHSFAKIAPNEIKTKPKIF